MRIAGALGWVLLLASPGLAFGQGVEQPIPNAAGWQLTKVPQSGCFARRQGAQVDTIVTINNNDKLVLAAGHSDWNLANGQEDVTLKINDGAPLALKGDPVGNLILVLITDEAVFADLNKAHRLDWTLPSGHFTADVAGLGQAFQAVRACTHAAPTGTAT